MIKPNEQTQYFNVFVRNWWNRTANGGREPGAGPRRYLRRSVTLADAQAIAKAYNDTHAPGFLSRKSEFESI